VGTDPPNLHFWAVANVFTLEDLRELRRLKASLPAIMAAASGRSNFPPMNQFGGASNLERKKAREQLERVQKRIRELESKLGSVP
jgi:coenzyme F420-reducing hydrogenase alpha subunit